MKLLSFIFIIKFIAQNNIFTIKFNIEYIFVFSKPYLLPNILKKNSYKKRQISIRSE